jgi:hypothetical protein
VSGAEENETPSGGHTGRNSSIRRLRRCNSAFGEKAGPAVVKGGVRSPLRVVFGRLQITYGFSQIGPVPMGIAACWFRERSRPPTIHTKRFSLRESLPRIGRTERLSRDGDFLSSAISGKGSFDDCGQCDLQRGPSPPGPLSNRVDRGRGWLWEKGESITRLFVKITLMKSELLRVEGCDFGELVASTETALPSALQGDGGPGHF